MKPDGTDQRKITSLGAMSWAPIFHPSGDYIIFATNLLGFDNFELYMVDAEGERPPVRVTDRKGFDGLSLMAQDVLRQDPFCGAVFAALGVGGDGKLHGRISGTPAVLSLA